MSLRGRGLLALPPIDTSRLTLRPLISVDAEAFRAMTDEPGITEVVHFLVTPFTLADATRLIVGRGDGRDCFWGIWTPGEPSLIGTIGTHLFGDDELEIGYWLSTAHHGRGLAFEAVVALLPVLASAYPRRRIFAECRPQNVGSWRLLERVGFAPDGTAGKRDGRRRLVFAAAAHPTS